MDDAHALVVATSNDRCHDDVEISPLSSRVFSVAMDLLRSIATKHSSPMPKFDALKLCDARRLKSDQQMAWLSAIQSKRRRKLRENARAGQREARPTKGGS